MVVLDTHAWVWWVGGPGCPGLSPAAQRCIEGATSIGVPATSCVEVAWLVRHGRLRFDREPLTWMQQALARPKVELLPTTPEVAVRASELVWDHRDPADRLIVATALVHRAPLVTADAAILAFTEARGVW